MNIAMLWHGDDSGPEDYWNCPLGLSFAFKRLGHSIDIYKFDAANCNLDRLYSNIAKYEFISVFWPWTSNSLDNQIKKIRTCYNGKIIIELGDEPQTFGQAFERIKSVDAAFTPDFRCFQKYKEMGLNHVSWLNHWGDEFLFKYKEEIPRKNVCVTTCGDRPGINYIQSSLGDKFVNKKIPPQENTSFYNSGTVAFQYARYDEITRRLFEAGGCKLAVVTNRISAATGIYDLFVDGKDIMYYSNPTEAVEQIEYLLNNEYVRETLAERIYSKVNVHHRAETRAQQIIDIIKSV
jgi:glycosyltransferase involved in cell wall biosynthesis